MEDRSMRKPGNFFGLSLSKEKKRKREVLGMRGYRHSVLVVVLLVKDQRMADLSGWVTIVNESGATYRNASLKLVAGDVHRVREEGLRVMALAKEKGEDKVLAPRLDGRRWLCYGVDEIIFGGISWRYRCLAFQGVRSEGGIRTYWWNGPWRWPQDMG